MHGTLVSVNIPPFINLTFPTPCNQVYAVNKNKIIYHGVPRKKYKKLHFYSRLKSPLHKI